MQSKTNGPARRLSATALAGVSAIAVSLAASAARADQTSATNAQTNAAVAEIVVTATRREAVNVMQVPLAVDAYSGQTIQQLDLTSESDLAKLDPSLDIQSYGPVDEKIIIRGISSTTGATTGVYLDETPLEGGFNANIPGDNLPTVSVEDINHVEVLKGPQGTLFGAGSMDGTVRFVTNQPNLESYSGRVEAGIAGLDHGDALFDGSGTLNAPIIKDQLGLRITLWGSDGGGYINQTLPDGQTINNVNNSQIYGLRAELLWQPVQNFSILGMATYQNTHVNGAQNWTPYIGGDQYPYSPFIGPYPAYSNQQLVQAPYWDNFQLYSITATYDLSVGQIIANTSYGSKYELFTADTSPQDCAYYLCTGFGYDPAMYSANSNFWYTTDDVRFASALKGPFQIVAGIYYEHDHIVYDGSVMNASPTTGEVPCYTWNQCSLDGFVKNGPNLGPPPYYAPIPSPANVVQFANESRQTTDEVAFYTQADWKILSNLTATVGFRYFNANIEYELINQQDISPPSANDFCSYLTGCVTTPYVSATLSGRESQPTYNFSLLWAATPDLSFYVRAASGFRLGGLNEAATIAAETGLSLPSTYAPDSLWDYEGGVKAYFLNKQLFIDLAAFHIDWSNQQQDAIAYGTYNYTLNVGKTSTNGVEFSATYRPIPDLTLSGGFSYVDARLASNLPANVVDAGTPGVIGDPVPFVPHWTLTGLAQYQHHLTDKIVGYLGGDFTYHGSSYSAFQPVPANAAPNLQDYDTYLPAYFLLDLNAGVRWDRYDIGVFARNVTNTVAWEGASGSAGGVSVWSPPPLTVGVRASASF